MEVFGIHVKSTSSPANPRQIRAGVSDGFRTFPSQSVRHRARPPKPRPARIPMNTNKDAQSPIKGPDGGEGQPPSTFPVFLVSWASLQVGFSERPAESRNFYGAFLCNPCGIVGFCRGFRAGVANPSACPPRSRHEFPWRSWVGGDRVDPDHRQSVADLDDLVAAFLLPGHRPGLSSQLVWNSLWKAVALFRLRFTSC
jgi:hypothetical protein